MTSFPRFRLQILALAVVSIATTACDNPNAAAPPPPLAPVEVGVVRVQAQKLVIKNELPGRTSAYRVAEVRPQVDGIILERLFREGSEVEAGQQLYQIDPASYKAAYDLAKADLDKAKAALKFARLKAGRYTVLVKKETVSRHAYDEAISAVEQGGAQVNAAKAALDVARINLDYTKVSSPISGRIGKSAFTEGALVTANQMMPLATVTQLDPIYVDVTQSSLQLLKLRKDIAQGNLSGADATQAPVTLVMEDGQEYAEPGHLQFSEVTVDETTGSIRLRAVFPNPREELLPGLFVRAVIRQAEIEQAILVPQQGVIRNADGSTAVWLVSTDGTVVPQTVTVSRAVGDKWLVDSGLEDDDIQIVVQGFQKTKPGAQVKAVPIGKPVTSIDASPNTSTR